MTKGVPALALCSFLNFVVGCNSSRPGNEAAPLPREVIDLSPTITEDLPVRIWGHRALNELGFLDSTEFRVLRGTDPVYYQNSYYTLMNHGGPHLDAPNHLERGEARGVDSYRLESLIGPIKLVDVRGPSADQPNTLPMFQ
jgi:kynurenine formamidase